MNMYKWMSNRNFPSYKLSKGIDFNSLSINLGEKTHPVSNLGEKIDPNLARHILIATTWRSGSTFLLTC